MATMTLEVARDGAPEPLRYSVELPDGDVDRISVAYAAIMFPNGVLVSEATESEPAAYRAPTGAEVLGGAAAAMVKQMTETAFQWHRKKAIRDAEASVAPISAEPV